MIWLPGKEPLCPQDLPYTPLFPSFTPVFGPRLLSCLFPHCLWVPPGEGCLWGSALCLQYRHWQWGSLRGMFYGRVILNSGAESGWTMHVTALWPTCPVEMRTFQRILMGLGEMQKVHSPMSLNSLHFACSVREAGDGIYPAWFFCCCFVFDSLCCLSTWFFINCSNLWGVSHYRRLAEAGAW